MVHVAGLQGPGYTLPSHETTVRSVPDPEESAPPVLTHSQIQREIIACTPGYGPQWSRYFTTRYARTSDVKGRVATIPGFQYVLNDCKAFEDGVDYHGEKTRQMMISWITASEFLNWCMLGHNASGFLTSRKERLVDDGGNRSTINSLFGRMRYIYRGLPPWMQEAAPVNFSHLRMDCERSGGYVVGEGATGEGGRSGSYARAGVDEAAFMPGEGWFRAIRSACPEGLALKSTPNGKDNIFWRIKYKTPGDFRFGRAHWTQHPVRAHGWYYEIGKDGEPTKNKRSPWYDKETANLTPDERAREYDISYEHSVSGLWWPEYDEDIHLGWDVVYDPTLPLYGGMDYGGAAATTCVLFQAHGREMWILADYEVWNADVDDHAPAIAAIIARITGGRVERHEVQIWGDPAGNAKEMTNKDSTVIRAYQAHGFKGMRAAPRKTPKDSIRLVRRKFYRDEMRIHMECGHVRERLPGCRYKTDGMGIVVADVMEENASKHMGDAIRYGALGAYLVDEDFSSTVEQPEIPNRHDSRNWETARQPGGHDPMYPGVGTLAPPMDTRY